MVRYTAFFSGDMTLRATIGISVSICLGFALLGWFLVSFTVGLPEIRIRLILSHLHLILLGFFLIYGASIISQATRNSCSGLLAKIIGFIISLLMMIAGMVMIIFVSSGELAWMIYVSEGLYS